MQEFDYVFIVCTYGTEKDLITFIESVNNVANRFRIIVANSYCNEESKEKIRNVAEQNNCDFLDLENKGYGNALNEGIAFARKNYLFKYIIITNADIILKRLDLSKAPEGKFVAAPEIITINGKRQNPFYIHPHFKLFHISKWYRKTFKKDNSLIVVAVAKIERNLFNAFFKRKKHVWKKIFAGHGAHILFSKETIDTFPRPFEDNIFLYCEENFLGYKMMKNNIPFYYTNDISVIHMEDGSKAFYKHSINTESLKSIEKYHELIKDE